MKFKNLVKLKLNKKFLSIQMIILMTVKIKHVTLCTLNLAAMYVEIIHLMIHVDGYSLKLNNFKIIYDTTNKYVP